MTNDLSTLLEDDKPQQLATGFEFTEAPTWHPDGFFYFVDIRPHRLFKVVPGQAPELVRDNTSEGNGTTLDLQGNLVMCQMGERRVVRLRDDGSFEPIAERFEGGRFNRPNDIVCASDGSLYFTDPDLRVDMATREQMHCGVYRIAPDGGITCVANSECPNGLAFSPDESILYVANTRFVKHIMAVELDEKGGYVRRRVFADMSADGQGAPDGLKVDTAGNVWCTGVGGLWVFRPDGSLIAIVPTPEPVANFAFGGADMRTLFLAARPGIWTMRVKTPGLPNTPYAKR